MNLTPGQIVTLALCMVVFLIFLELWYKLAKEYKTNLTLLNTILELQRKNVDDKIQNEPLSDLVNDANKSFGSGSVTSIGHPTGDNTPGGAA